MPVSHVLQKTLMFLKSVDQWQKNISLYNLYVKGRYPIYGCLALLTGLAYTKRDFWLPSTRELRAALNYEKPGNRQFFDQVRAEYHEKLSAELFPNEAAVVQ
ncbi:hypothetical protein HHI36_011168 [Cryptolaemus montrouzieri]|uniref:Uncharacterized protein n=1 Tax=Cryptolaemus montrouzieri TaxID=559131 RepID=A0ABD2ML23_9CUCU